MNATPYISKNPYTEEVLQSYSFTNTAACNKLLTELKNRQRIWAVKSIEERIAFLPQLGKALRDQADRLAILASTEMGKIRTHAKAEVLKSATLCDYYYEQAPALLKPESLWFNQNTDIEKHWSPMGVVLGVFPWNFPYWQILRSAIPTLVSGNAMLVKPAPNVPQCSLALTAIIEEILAEDTVFKTAFLSEEDTALAIEHDAVAAVTLTGSARAGAVVASKAASVIKPAVLELGGSDPLLVLADAPLDEIMDELVFSRFQNNGQSCVAAKRFLIEDAIYDTFLDKLIARVERLRIGDPLEENTDLGPQARHDLRELLKNQVDQSVAAGAKIAYRHAQIPNRGYFYPPTILAEIPPHAPAYTQELFGPVLGIYRFTTDEEAIQIANATPYGLGASIFSRNTERAAKLAQQIESGMVYINQMVKSDVSAPFGGIKQSGFGRELGAEGLRAFCQVKTYWRKK